MGNAFEPLLGANGTVFTGADASVHGDLRDECGFHRQVTADRQLDALRMTDLHEPPFVAERGNEVL